MCIVTVGGSGVGAHLLRRVIAAFPEAKQRVPELRMIVVAGPRIDPASCRRPTASRSAPTSHDLYRHLAACDLAVVQGGLTTSMELTANRRPFLYFPLGHHFEQNFHVRHRLERYGAGRRMDFEADGPAEIAAAIAEEIGREVDYRAVETDGARRAAERIAEMLTPRPQKEACMATAQTEHGGAGPPATSSRARCSRRAPATSCARAGSARTRTTARASRSSPTTSTRARSAAST